MEFEMSCRIEPKEKYVCISKKEIWRNLDGPPKNLKTVNYKTFHGLREAIGVYEIPIIC